MDRYNFFKVELYIMGKNIDDNAYQWTRQDHSKSTKNRWKTLQKTDTHKLHLLMCIFKTKKSLCDLTILRKKNKTNPKVTSKKKKKLKEMRQKVKM